MNGANDFKTRWPVSDAMFILQQIIEKHWELYKENYLAFINFVKAFGNIIRAKLWSKLER